jgi:phage protein D
MSERAAVFYYVAKLGAGGESDPVDLTDRVRTFTFTDREGGLDRLQLTVDNKDLSNFDDPLFEYGVKLRVAFGNGQSSSPLRDMVIRKVTGGRELTINAVTKDGARLDTVKKRRRFENVRRSDVIAQLARENGFATPDIEESPEIFDSIAQGNLTDGQLMRKLADLEGFEFFIDAFGLHWHRRRVDQAPIREYIYFTDPAGGEILDFNIENDITRRPGKVSVCSRDPITKEKIQASASNDEDKDRDTMAGYALTITEEDASLIAEKEEVVHETTVASNVQTQEDADRAAKAAYRKSQQRAVKLSLKLRGDPSLVAKTVVEVKGLGNRISGKYYVREVVHSLDATGGYDMDVKTITDGFQGGRGKGGSPSGDGAASLTAAATALKEAAYNVLAIGIDDESGAVTGDLAKLEAISNRALGAASALELLSKQSGDELAKNAARAAKLLQSLASAAKKSKAVDVAIAAANAAAVCQRIAEAPADIKAKGKQNTKDVNDSAVRPVDTVDADGREVKRYQNTGGRET